MKRSVATWVVTSPPESSGEASMSELGHSFFFGLFNHRQYQSLLHVLLALFSFVFNMLECSPPGSTTSDPHGFSCRRCCLWFLHSNSSMCQMPQTSPLTLADVSYSPLHSSLLDVPKHFWMDNSNSRYPSREFTEPMKVHFPLPGLATS
jgi:hypothetical protein